MRLHAAPLALCVASLLTIVLAVSGCDKNLPDTGGALPGVAVHRDSDAVVAAAVETALRSNEDFRQLDIAVATRKGDVRLTGAVSSPEQHAQTIKLARTVAGVHSVYDDLTPRL